MTEGRQVLLCYRFHLPRHSPGGTGLGSATGRAAYPPTPQLSCHRA
jgi:hypothetical protein